MDLLKDIRYIFQVPLEWFKKVDERVFGDHPGSGIKFESANDGSRAFMVDFDVLDERYGGGSGEGTVTAVDGVGPNASGNVVLNALKEDDLGVTVARQSDLETAQQTADDAQTAAEDAQAAAESAGTSAESAATAAANAQTTANNAATAAETAQQTANNAATAAETAQQTANNAATAADNAQSTAYGAETAAATATSTANAAAQAVAGKANAVHAHGNIASDGKMATASKVVVTNVNREVSLDAVLSPSKLATIQSAALVTDDENDVLKKLLLRHVSSSSVSGITLDATTSSSTIRLGYSSTIESTIVGGTDGRLALSGVVGINLSAPANGVKLDNAPTEQKTATSSKSVATCGWTATNFLAKENLSASKWVKTDANGNVTTTDEKPISADSTKTGFVLNTAGTISYVAGKSGTVTKKVLTGVTWNGTTLSYSSENWTFTNGILTNIVSNSATTIDTPVVYTGT